ncbi:MAG TPA: ribonuclease H-like domain-containing protein [Nannocystaceae bacterium]|nr:ribonuclease H-like domain-containing protein [Nannocystaceae bacterium]
MTVQQRLAAFASRVRAQQDAPSGQGFAIVDAPAVGSHGVAVRDGHALARALTELCPGDRERMPLFFDLETTGLSVDAPAFVIGLLGFDPHGEPWLKQLRLDGRAHEGALWRELHALVAAHAQRGRLVTYNGASFDRTIARLRLRRLGRWDDRVAALFDAHHVDLLPVCRRLWRATLPDHRLVTLERDVLRATRRDDPPGSEIARLGAAWIDGARDRSTSAGVDAVLRHNADDLLGLAALVHACARVLAAPRKLAEAIGAARQLQRTQRSLAALAVLRPWVARDPPKPAHAMSIDAAVMLAVLERRHGDRDRAHALWQLVRHAAPDHHEAVLALAKDFEHRLRSPARALAVLEAIAAEGSVAQRVARLTAKLGQPPSPAPAVDRPVDAARPALPGTWRARPRPPAPSARRLV